MMAEPLADQIMRQTRQAAELYHRLLLVVAPAGAGKTTALHDVRNRTGAPLVNVNLELSRRMLELTERQRALQLPRLLREIVDNGGGEMILLDNPSIFPFRLAHISAERVASLSPRLNILRHGLDDDLVMLHEKGGVK